jgi:hypothetical protein
MTDRYVITIPPDIDNLERFPTWTRGWRNSMIWCCQHIGQQGQDWDYLGIGQFDFAREQDAVMFALRWVA